MQMRPQLPEPSLTGSGPSEDVRGVGRGGVVWDPGVGRSQLWALKRGHGQPQVAGPCSG